MSKTHESIPTNPDVTTTVDVNAAFDPEARQAQAEARQAQAELNEALESRPYKDDNGRMHDPKTGKFAGKGYFEQARDAHYEEVTSSYEDMTLPELARAAAKAEYEVDATKLGDIEDALADKLSAEEDKINSDGDREDNNERSDNLWNRVAKIRSKEMSRLSGKDEKIKEAKDNYNNAEDSDKSKSEADDNDDNGKTESSKEKDDVDVEQERHKEIASEIKRIKGEMATRWANHKKYDTDYDSDFENQQDDMVKQLLKELLDDDHDGSRLKKDVKIADDFAERLSDRMERVLDQINDLKKNKAGRWTDFQKHGSHYESEFEEGSEDGDIIDILCQFYDTDDPNDPRVTRQVELANTFEQAERYLMMYEDDNEDKKKPSHPKKFEYVATSDPKEAKAFWRAELKDQGVSLQAYLSHENQWLVKREVEEDPTKPTPQPPKPTPPTTPRPPRPTPSPPVKPVRVPMPPDRNPEKKPTNDKRLLRKLGAVATGAVLVVGGYIAGRVNENRLIKAGDPPAVDAVNKFGDHTHHFNKKDRQWFAMHWGQVDDTLTNNSDGLVRVEKQIDALTQDLESQGIKHDKAVELAREEVQGQLDAINAQNELAQAEHSQANAGVVKSK